MVIYKILAEIGVTANDIGLPNSTKDVGTGVTSIVQLLFGLVGGLAVAALLYGGVQLALSEGDPGKIKNARATMTYAIVGIILAASAFLVVWFVSHNLFSGPDFKGTGN